MSARAAGLAWLCTAIAAAGCGSSASAAEEPTSPVGEGEAEPPPPLGTREPVDLRGPLAAVALDDGRVRVLARTADAGAVAGVATVRDGRWLAETLRFEPTEEAELAEALRASGVWATASADGVVLERTGEAPRVLTERAAREAAAAAHGDGWAVAFADDDGVHLVTLDARGAASTPRLVDDGRRPGEPAHRVGAALTLASHAGRLVLAYQDQTLGTLVLTPVPAGAGRPRPLGLPSHGFTRALHVALVSAGPHLLVLDLAARGPHLTLLAQGMD